MYPNSAATRQNGEVNVPTGRLPLWKRLGFWLVVSVLVAIAIDASLGWRDRLPKGSDEQQMEKILGRKPYR